MRNLSFFSLKPYLQLLRPLDWSKNLFVLVPLVFSKHFLIPEDVITALISFFCFSIASSIVYVINDLEDVEKDKLHPIKKNRPIASGRINHKSALFVIVVLSVILVAGLWLLNWKFILIVLGYILMNVFYSVSWKNIVIIDLFSIAGGFMLRVIGGALTISVYISSWLVITTLFVSLFLAAMKRRVEIASSANAYEKRLVLKEYPLNFIDQVAAISAGGVVLSYALYTVSERTIKFFNTEYLIYSIIFVIYGIFRYMYLVYKKNKGENASEVLLTDFPMLANFILYAVFVFVIIYLIK